MPPLTEIAPNEPEAGWAEVRVSVPVPILLISGKATSLKRMKRPAKVVSTLLKPTLSVGLPRALKTSPEPERPPQVVFWLLRSRRVPAFRTRVERREPALVTPVRMPPAATVKSEPKKDWARKSSTPLPVLVMPPVEPTTAWRASVGRSGSTSVKPPTEIGAMLIVFAEAPKSTRPSRNGMVVTLAEVAWRPPAPMVRTPREPLPVASVFAKLRTKPVPLEPSLLNVSLVMVLSPKRIAEPLPLTVTSLPTAMDP